MPYTVKAVPNTHDPAVVKYHVIPGDEPVGIHDTEEAATEHAWHMNTYGHFNPPPKSKKAKAKPKAKAKARKKR